VEDWLQGAHIIEVDLNVAETARWHHFWGLWKELYLVKKQLGLDIRKQPTQTQPWHPRGQAQLTLMAGTLHTVLCYSVSIAQEWLNTVISQTHSRDIWKLFLFSSVYGASRASHMTV